ncbi:MAG: hypothetical protein LAO09_06550 [Acidobacteriia bacterium]|nr:hypothetical protein [Terriglobia bacterium]
MRSSPGQFKAFADEMKSKGEGIVLTTKLLSGAQELRDMVCNAEIWIANAEMHVGRIPTAKARYEQIESEMKSLLTQERVTPNSAARSQISVAVMQGDVAAEQVDIQLQQVWDLGIGDSGLNLSKEFTKWDANCDPPDTFRKRGATAQSIGAWERACKQALAEREKFVPIFRHTMEQRAELKSFQAVAQAHRKAVVDEANQIQ